ncbi:MAG: S-methyl-5-thioribose-1-phosphate isomerase [Bacteroidia bacterium]
MNPPAEIRRSLWLHPDNPACVQVIDQRALPHTWRLCDLCTLDDVVLAIREMWVRGAPLIGVTAAYGMYLAAIEAARHPFQPGWAEAAAEQLLATRPTAVNLRWAVHRQLDALRQAHTPAGAVARAYEIAADICEEDVARCRAIGEAGLPLIQAAAQAHPGQPVQVLTHCNAGWLACIEWGTATAPIYLAHQQGIPLHVWVDETRPRNQGASLTAWELAQAGIPHTVISDNAGGHLMQQGLVDLCIVGTDRTTRLGDVANKIGTYLKALAAQDNGVPFYVALPSSSIDWTLADGQDIPIEMRDGDEVAYLSGWDEQRQEVARVRLVPQGSPTRNDAFDITPARLVTGLITERGICPASEAGLAQLFPAFAHNFS